MPATDTLNIMLIGENIETQIVFKNALSKLGKLCNIGDYFSLDKAVAQPGKFTSENPHIIFLDTTSNALDCSNNVKKIRNFEPFKNCSLVVYDSHSQLRDTDAIFFEGADVFINKPYDFPRLKKVMSNIVNAHWHGNQSDGNRVNYFL